MEQDPSKQTKPKGRKKLICRKSRYAPIKWTEEENTKIRNKMDEYNITSYSTFIRHCVFERDITVIYKQQQDDSPLYKVIEWLTKIHSQWRSVGVNYNQTVKHINTTFGKNQASFLLKNLETQTIKLIALTEKIALITEELRKRFYDTLVQKEDRVKEKL
jgi:hypothetical protein